MIIELTYDEMDQFVQSNYGHRINLAFVSSNTICVSTDIDFKLFKKHIE